MNLQTAYNLICFKRPVPPKRPVCTHTHVNHKRHFSFLNILKSGYETFRNRIFSFGVWFLKLTPQNWVGKIILPTVQTILPTVRAILPTVQTILPTVRAILPTVRTILPTVRIILPTVRIILPTVRTILPTVRIILPTVQTILPTVRTILPTAENNISIVN